MRATLQIILSGERLTKSAICVASPCSPATLYRYFPDIKQAAEDCFLSDAAKAFGAPYFRGLKSACEEHSSLQSRLHAIIELQNTYVLSHMKFVRAVAKVTTRNDLPVNEPLKLALFFCDKLAEEELGPYASDDAKNTLARELEQVVGYRAMLSCYQLALAENTNYRDHCRRIVQTIVGGNTAAVDSVKSSPLTRLGFSSHR